MASNFNRTGFDSTTVIDTWIAGNWGCTVFKRTSFDYLWIIEDICLYDVKCTKYDGLYSPIFKDNEGYSEWRLSLFFNCNDVQILLQSVKYDKSPELKAAYSISVLNDKNEAIKTVKKMTPHNFKNWQSSVLIPTNFIFNESNELLYGNTLSILCEVFILQSKSELSGSKLDRKSDVSCLAVRNLLQSDLSKLFENGQFSDVTLVAGGREFRCHKAILSARSDVFAAMFDHKMKENTLNRVVITDIKPDVIEQMLGFIYASQTANIKEMAKELLIAADKYALTQLKQMCEYELAFNINVESAAEILAIADLYNANHLKTNATKFINVNAHKVIKTDGWKNLMKTHGELVTEIYIAAVENRMGKCQNLLKPDNLDHIP